MFGENYKMILQKKRNMSFKAWEEVFSKFFDLKMFLKNSMYPMKYLLTYVLLSADSYKSFFDENCLQKILPGTKVSTFRAWKHQGIKTKR